jgi:hypothetical protein
VSLHSPSSLPTGARASTRSCHSRIRTFARSGSDVARFGRLIGAWIAKERKLQGHTSKEAGQDGAAHKEEPANEARSRRQARTARTRSATHPSNERNQRLSSSIQPAGCASRGRISRTIAAESNATPAKVPKMILSGTWRSLRTPKTQSAKPPKVMLTKFMIP